MRALFALVSTACTAEFDLRGARAGSGFGIDDDGWTIVGDAQAESVKPDFDGFGGNPDGLISAKDDVAGGVWYFHAPSKYSGDASLSIGKKLAFDLKTTTLDNPFDDYDVLLQGGGVTIAFDTPNDPGPDWTSYSIPLSDTVGWRRIDSLDVEYGSVQTFEAKPPATLDDLTKVLGGLSMFRIRGEFNTGADTGSLDNVRFGAD